MLDADRARTSEPTQVMIVSGRSPPGGCGIEDYTACLVGALQARGFLVDYEHVTSCADLRRLLRAVRGRVRLVHVQYPVVSWRSSLVPVAMAAILRWVVRARVAVTLHEFSRAHPFRRGLCIALGRVAQAWIATTEVEARLVGAHLGPRKVSAVIPVASSIPTIPVAERGPRVPKVLYFGLLARGKGLEAFLDLARRLPSAAFEVVGRPAVGQESWLDEIMRGSQDVAFRIDLRDRDVAHALASGTVAYLPFPDGLSERRTSALAVLSLGLQLVTTNGPATTAALKRIAHVVSSEAEAVKVVSGLLHGSVEPRPREDIEAYLNQRSWHKIAEAHVDLYQRMMEFPRVAQESIFRRRGC